MSIRHPVVGSCRRLGNELCDPEAGGWLGGGSNGGLEASLSLMKSKVVIRRDMLSHPREG